MRFLYEADLIGKSLAIEGSMTEERDVIKAIINLQAADLSGVNLSGITRSDIYIYPGGTKTVTVTIRVALAGANLAFVNLSGADLRNANLRDAEMETTKRDVRMSQARSLVIKSFFQKPLSQRTEESRHAFELELTKWYEQLSQAKSLIGATLTGEAVMTEEAWRSVEWEKFMRREQEEPSKCEKHCEMVPKFRTGAY